MNEIQQSMDEPKALPGWVCLAIGVGFIAGISALLVAVRILA
jgi:type III secretory pathway component EscV